MADEKEKDNLEAKVTKKADTPTEALLTGTLVGVISEFIAPSSSLLARGLSTLLYGGVIAPLVTKLFKPKAPMAEIYKNSPYEALGFFGGGYIPPLAQYLKAA